MEKALAMVCRVCPFCILRRMFPESRYGRFMRRAEQDCPCCRAYDELYAKPGASEPHDVQGA